MWAQYLAGGVGSLGVPMVIAAFFLLRSQRDVNIAQASKDVIEGQATYIGQLEKRNTDLVARVVELEQRVHVLEGGSAK